MIPIARLLLGLDTTPGSGYLCMVSAHTHTHARTCARTQSAWVNAIDRSDNVSSVCRLVSPSHLSWPPAISARPRLSSLRPEKQTREIKPMRKETAGTLMFKSMFMSQLQTRVFKRRGKESTLSCESTEDYQEV